ncbi:hypothetical protein RHGRI_003794 [Rhododendron griersonianum]|uniref:F-box associated beta-propeller type 1 domain-containing protein n=1 Tax=Rhododendron griersonianum TaxID=479676 RepID=A0AAV6L695_9ERIC|nr:hypothetical protein RHGRI_003794 [Rhododendron griersonianum]
MALVMMSLPMITRWEDFFVKVGTNGIEVEVMVCALRTPSWRRIEGFPHRLPSDGLGTYLNGALHWTGCSDSNGSPIIVSVDLVKETHGEVLEPDYRDGLLYRSLLDVLNGCLVCYLVGEALTVLEEMDKIPGFLYFLPCLTSTLSISDLFSSPGTQYKEAFEAKGSVLGLDESKGSVPGLDESQGSVLGSCDGLVCVETDSQVSIWNPSTRKSKRLNNMPHPPFISYGFGYDESTDDYKVAGFFGRVGTSCFEFEVKVYALRTASWRRIEGSPHRVPSDGLGTYLNGALHWTGRNDSNVGPIIVSVDLVKETHGEVLEPDYLDGDHLHRRLLDVLNGCLCILCAYRDYVDLWVMKEYGSRESWTKLVLIPYETHPIICPYSTTPLCILKNGEVLLHSFIHLVRYNPKDGTFVYPTIHNGSVRFLVYPYVKSLVSPDIDSDGGVQWQH